MDPGAIARSIADQFVTVWNTPVPFLAVCVALWLLLRWHIRGQFETRLVNAQSTIDMLEKQLDRGEAKTAVAKQGQHILPPPELAPRDISVTTGDTDFDAVKKLMALYRSHTKLQAAEVMQQYYGNKLVLTGTINNVGEPHWDKSVMASLEVSDDLVFCSFNEATDQIKNLRKGDKVTVEGSIKVVDNAGVEITDCTIL
jgi:hypothetical protein